MQKLISLYLVFLISAGCLFAQAAPAPPQIQVTQLGPGLYLLPVYSVNTVVFAGEDGVLIIDAGYEQAHNILLAELKKLNAENVKYIINTHWHFDHCGGNKNFSDHAVILSHKNVRDLLSRDEMLLGQMQKAYPENARPEITFQEPVTIHLNGDDVEIVPLIGGHTHGDVIVHFKDKNVVHIGDIIFSDMFPFIDVDHGGNVVRLADNLKKLMEIIPEKAKIIPGHGREYSMEDVKKYREMLIATTEIVRKEIENKRSVDDMIEADVLKDWKNWEGSFSCSDWIEMVYASLTSEK